MTGIVSVGEMRIGRQGKHAECAVAESGAQDPRSVLPLDYRRDVVAFFYHVSRIGTFRTCATSTVTVGPMFSTTWPISGATAASSLRRGAGSFQGRGNRCRRTGDAELDDGCAECSRGSSAAVEALVHALFLSDDLVDNRSRFFRHAVSLAIDRVLSAEEAGGAPPSKG